MIKPLENNTHRTALIGLTHKKDLPYVIIFFTLASIITSFVAWHGTSPVSVFFIGEIIIWLLIIDMLRIKILMHLYQVILVYFYFSLVVFHSFNDKSAEFYDIAYFVSVLHALFFGCQPRADKGLIVCVQENTCVLSSSSSFLFLLFLAVN